VITIGRDDKVTGTVTRHVIGPRGPQSGTRSFSATLGKRSPLMKEVGAGAMRRQAVIGGTVEILSSCQVSSSCRVQ
jgi:hypothetical protein